MRTVLEVAIWWIVCTGVWLLGLSAVTLSDLVLGLIAGLLSAILAAVCRRLVGGHWRPRPRWFVRALRVPVAVVLETGSVLAAAARPHDRRSEEQRIRMPHDEREDVADAREAVTIVAVSLSPGTYVIDTDPDTRELLVHTLGAQAPAWGRYDAEAR